jgi:hypothetical protein
MGSGALAASKLAHVPAELSPEPFHAPAAPLNAGQGPARLHDKTPATPKGVTNA